MIRPLAIRWSRPIRLPAAAGDSAYEAAIREHYKSRFGLISETQRADFLQNALELWRRREAHGSIRIQEGESPRLQHMTHLCAIMDAANAPKKRGSYKKASG
jgi:hypothetical protein